MKYLLILAAAAVMLLISGCVSATSTPVVSMPKAEFAASIIQPLAQGGVPLVLNKNPELAPAVLLLSDLLPAILGSGDLTPAGIAGSIQLADRKASLGISPDAQALLANLISIAVSQYQTHYGTGVVAATDPGVMLLVQSFSKGLKDGVTTWKVAHGG